MIKEDVYILALRIAAENLLEYVGEANENLWGEGNDYEDMDDWVLSTADWWLQKAELRLKVSNEKLETVGKCDHVCKKCGQEMQLICFSPCGT